MATRWTWPFGPMVATVELRCWFRKPTTSSCSMALRARWLAMTATEGVGRGDAAVEGEVRAVDAGRLVAAEEDVERGDVPGVAHAAQRGLGRAGLHRDVAAVHAGHGGVGHH